MLVISSPGPVYDKLREVWRTYMHTHPTIDAFFVESHPVIVPRLDGDVLRVPGKEMFSTIRHKTLRGIEYFFGKQHYTHVVRTNLSSFWIYSRLLERLLQSPTTNLYAGIFLKDRSISGAGICMTRDVAEKLLHRRSIVFQRGDGYYEWDDVSFGRALLPDTPPTHFGRFDLHDPSTVEAHIQQLPSDYFHIRVRQTDYTNRTRESEMMRKLVDVFYK